MPDISLDPMKNKSWESVPDFTKKTKPEIKQSTFREEEKIILKRREETRAPKIHEQKRIQIFRKKQTPQLPKIKDELAKDG